MNTTTHIKSLYEQWINLLRLLKDQTNTDERKDTTEQLIDIYKEMATLKHIAPSNPFLDIVLSRPLCSHITLIKFS